MVELPERKVGVIACSGEELAEGTVTRLAALKVLHELRRGRTVTICLPLFLAGGEGDRAFARFHPTVTVDGCDLRCAARCTAMYSGTPSASLVVSDLVVEAGLPAVEGRRRLNDAGRRAVDLVAERLARTVDRVLDGSDLGTQASAAEGGATVADGTPVATCSCGSGVPVTRVAIEGRQVELLALPLIFRQFRDAGARPDDWDSLQKLMEAVKIYNEVPLEEELAYQQVVAREYREFWRREGPR